MHIHASFLRAGLAAAAAGVLLAGPLHAQTVDDALMVGKHELLTGNVHTYDTWDTYWEGTFKRQNGNIGDITTRTNVWTANYGLTERLNVIGAVPYVWTRPSQGVLHGDQGFQDLSLAAKYRLFEVSHPDRGTVRAFAVGSAGLPLTDYNNELLPLSIGTRTKQASARGTLTYQPGSSWFFGGTAAYNWRADAKLDRLYVYTNDEFVMSDTVDMPNTTDHTLMAGWMTPRLTVAGFLGRMLTLGGGDIRRQDMPFVSNRMNATRVGAMGMVPLPFYPSLQVQFAAARTIEGRNVGQATTVTAGLLYRFNRRVTP